MSIERFGDTIQIVIIRLYTPSARLYLALGVLAVEDC